MGLESMSSASNLPTFIVESRQRLAEARAAMQARHDAKESSILVCEQWTEQVDSIIKRLTQRAAEAEGIAWPLNGVSLVAHAGYGRRDLAPYSDIDLMLLYSPGSAAQSTNLARHLSQWIVDTGFQLGFTLRTTPQALAAAWSDPQIFTSLSESRFLEGDVELYTKYLDSLRAGASRRCTRLIETVEKARLDERKKYGETVYMLQPNIKRSRGGLRDVQLVRWIAFAKYGLTNIDQLATLGYLDPGDHLSLKRGYEFLLRIRNQLHFEAKKSQDGVDRAAQVRLAAWSGEKGREGLLPVEQFMREYFEQTSEIRYVSAHFLNASKGQSWMARQFGPWISFQVQGDFRVGVRHVWAHPAAIEKLRSDPAKVIELMMVANRHNRRIDHETWQAIRQGMLARQAVAPKPEVIEVFMEMMQQPNRLGDSLRRLHELRVLEQIVPAMKHARSLLQFNEYHKYTVDAHCIRSVEVATEFARDETVLGSVYRSIKNKALLHLALLLHDLGKGFTEDHSEVGKRIAEETGRLLRLSESDRELLVFLVHQHLLLTHTAFRYDLSLLETTVRFAAQVGSYDSLQMLFVLSCADLAAVGPGALNDWKLGLITQLYQRTESQFRDERPDQWFQQELEERRLAIRKQVAEEADQEWWQAQIQGTSANYLFHYPKEKVIQELGRLKSLSETKPALAWAEYLPSRNATEYTVGMIEPKKRIGIFHRITGALSSQGLQILSAEVHTQPDGTAWDRFLVQDLDFESQPSGSRIEGVCRAIESALDPKNQQPPMFRNIWKAKLKEASPVRNQPTQVQFDNNSSEDFTIISIFAYDRRGLLYSIAKVLFDQELDLQIAKISTHLDQVVDVFYVTDLEGKKVTEPTRLYTTRQRLLAAALSD